MAGILFALVENRAYSVMRYGAQPSAEPQWCGTRHDSCSDYYDLFWSAVLCSTMSHSHAAPPKVTFVTNSSVRSVVVKLKACNEPRKRSDEAIDSSVLSQVLEIV
jgi:hypothetical protein